MFNFCIQCLRQTCARKSMFRCQPSASKELKNCPLMELFSKGPLFFQYHMQTRCCQQDNNVSPVQPSNPQSNDYSSPPPPISGCTPYTRLGRYLIFNNGILFIHYIMVYRILTVVSKATLFWYLGQGGGPPKYILLN